MTITQNIKKNASLIIITVLMITVIKATEETL